MDPQLKKLIERLYGIRTDGLTDDQIRAEMNRQQQQRRPVAGIEPETCDLEARTCEVIIATDAPVMVIDWKRWEIVDEMLLMDGLRLADIRKGKLPFLDSHQTDSTRRVLGSTINLRKANGQFLGTEHFSRLAEAELIKTSEGHLDQRSVGYHVDNYVRLEPGESGAVKGKTYTASETRALHVVTSWIANEESAVCIGADAGAGTRAATLPAQNSPKPNDKGRKVKDMKKKLRALLVELGMDKDATDEQAWEFHREHQDEIMARMESGNDPEGEPAKKPGKAKGRKQEPADPPDGGSGRQGEAPAEQGREALKLEGARVAAIRKAFAPYQGIDGVRELCDECCAIGSEISPAEANTRLLAKLEESTPGTGRGASVGEEDGEKRQRAMEACLVTRAVPTAAAQYGKDDLGFAAEYRGHSLYDMCRESLLRSGVSERDLHGLRRLDVVGVAFSGRLPNGRAIAHSTGDFSNILANTANKVLLAGFQSVNMTWKAWCYQMTVSDFKAHDLNMLSGFTVLSDVPAGGEFPQHSLSDKKESVTATTKGNIFSITRQAIINDDLNAFTRVPMLQGMASARTIERGAVAKLLANGNLSDSTALFEASTHKNLLTGTGYAPTTTEQAKAGLNGLKKLLRLQTGVGGEAILLEPEVVLCGPTAEDYIREAVADTSTTDKDRTPNRGIRGLVPYVTPYLENSAITGYSTTAYYVFANPVIAPVVVVALLDGQEEPYLESKEGWDVDGVEYKVRLDVGFGVADYRGATKATGVSA